MANDQTPNGAASTAVTAPAIPTADRLTVPVSALDLGLDNKHEIKAEVSRLTTRASDTPLDKPAEAPKAAEPVKTPVEAPKAAEIPKAEPVKTPVEAPAPEPAKDLKVKIGDKEYTTAELEKLVKERQTPAPAPAPPAAPVEATKPPTPEQIAQLETKWQSDFAASNKLSFAPTEEQVETILSGGADAAKTLSEVLTGVATKAVMLARKSIYDEINPVMRQFETAFAPIMQQHQQLDRIGTEQAFVQRHADFTPHLDQVRGVAEALVQRFPNEVSKMSREQFLDEVASQTDRILTSEYSRWSKTGTWREAGKAAPAAAPAAVAPPAPAVAPAPPAPAVVPPNANSPAGQAASGSAPNWHKDTARSLAG